MLRNLSDSFGVARRAEESFVGVGGSALLLRIFLRFAAGGDVEEIYTSFSGCCWTSVGVIARCVDVTLLRCVDCSPVLCDIIYDDIDHHVETNVPRAH